MSRRRKAIEMIIDARLLGNRLFWCRTVRKQKIAVYQLRESARENEASKRYVTINRSLIGISGDRSTYKVQVTADEAMELVERHLGEKNGSQE